MDELREKIKKYLEENSNRIRDYYDVKCMAMAWTAGCLENSRRSFSKVYDLVTEVVDDFVFGGGQVMDRQKWEKPAGGHLNRQLRNNTGEL